MIAYLKGKILKKRDKGIILNTGNIGYFVHLKKNLLPNIKENQEIEVFIHHYIKEDASDLYGFNNMQELDFFTQLLSISGIGPKVALEILNVPPNKMKSAIINEDESFICKIPGIGKKTAKRLILELKDKIEVENIENIGTGFKESHNEALEALIKLGYQKHHVMRTIKEAPKNIIKAEEIITYFLKNA